MNILYTSYLFLYVATISLEIQEASTKEYDFAGDNDDFEGRLSIFDFQNAEDPRFIRIPKISENINSNIPDIFEGDILSDELDYEHQLISNESMLWPKIGEYVVVPYTFPSTALESEKAEIARMVLEFRNKTCIRLQERKEESDWIHINTDRMGCASKVGRQGGMQTIRASACLGENGGFGLLVHEVMHSLGLYHQHSRSDRDDYITVNTTEIDRVQKEDFIHRDKYKKEYEICSECKRFGDYDISSIMHYPAHLGIKNRTIITPKPGVCDDDNCNMGQRMELSVGDVNDIQHLYDCGLKYDQYQDLFERQTARNKKKSCSSYNTIESYCDEISTKWNQIVQMVTESVQNTVHSYSWPSFQPMGLTQKLQINPANCPPGWINYALHCYTLYLAEKSWLDAQYLCQKNSAFLASIHSKDEYTFIREMIFVNSQSSAWIGGKKLYDGSEKWIWEDSSIFNYTKWLFGQPDDDQDEYLPACIYLNFADPSSWYDENCEKKFSFICKK